MSLQNYIQGLAGELVNVLREAGQVVPPALTKFGTHVKKKVCVNCEIDLVTFSFVECFVHVYRYYRAS